MSRAVGPICALIPGLPFAAALVGLLVPQWARRPAAVLAVGATALAGGLAVALLAAVLPHARRVVETGGSLAPFGGITVGVGTRVDGYAAVVTLMVCAVALAVQVYSVAYLADDDSYPRYAAQVSLFTAAMLLVVLGADLVEVLVGWEVMGLCSYLLIGHYRVLPAAAPAAVKAFVVTRFGDVGFLLGVLLLGKATGTFRIGLILSRVHSLPAGTLTAATLLLLAGVVGKSAQFPLHVWLPDAMAGPTPISALIHAATMVAAGVYVVARLYPLYAAAPVALGALAIIAAITMVLGAVAALLQDDLKRVLAWSTVSQLAYMFGGLAVGGVAAATFHLLTHAAFKALLFLAAGAVLHATGLTAMTSMGGLARRLPVTFGAMLVGALALAGVPPVSGSFSKDAVLDAAVAASRGAGPVAVGNWAGWLVLGAGLLTALLTAAYATRMMLLTFFGDYRGERVPHPPPRAMAWPVVALAVPAALLGAATPYVAHWVPPLVRGTGEIHTAPAVVAIAGALVLLGIAGMALTWRRQPELVRGLAVPPLRRPDIAGWYAGLARAVLAVDSRVVDGAVVGSGREARRLGGLLQRLQTGNVQAYATGLLAAVVVLAVVAVVR